MTTPLNPQFAFTVANVVIPTEGPKVAYAVLNFNGTDGTFVVDCSQIVQQGKISYIQTLWVDNADNPNSLTITTDLVGQRIIIPANVQQYVNVLAPNMPVFNVSTVTGNFKVNMGFLNVPMQPDQWSGAAAGAFAGLTNTQLRAAPVSVSIDAETVTLPVSIAAAVPVTIGATVVVENLGPAITDYSLVLNGADQVACTAGQAAHFLIIQNPTGNASVTINLAGASAATGIVLQAGGSLTIDNGVASAVHVKGTNTQSLVIYAG